MLIFEKWEISVLPTAVPPVALTTAAPSEKLPVWISAEDVGEKQKSDTYIPVLDGRVLSFLNDIGSAVLVIFDDMYQKKIYFFSPAAELG